MEQGGGPRITEIGVVGHERGRGTGRKIGTSQDHRRGAGHLQELPITAVEEERDIAAPSAVQGRDAMNEHIGIPVQLGPEVLGQRSEAGGHVRGTR